MSIRGSTAPTTTLPGQPPRRSRATALFVVLAVLALAAGAVVVVNLTRGSDAESGRKGPDNALGSPSAPASTVATDPQAATKAAILDAYRQAFDAFLAVASDPAGSPEDPRLSQHKIGNALLGAQVTITRLRKDGHVYRGGVEVHPTVVELTADTAVVADCGIDTVSVVDARTGQVVTPPGPPDVGSAGTATYRLINGVWMQNTFKDEKRSCVPPAS